MERYDPPEAADDPVRGRIISADVRGPIQDVIDPIIERRLERRRSIFLRLGF